ncbi:MAG: phage holin family protein [Chlorobi bacterium]|nr:phage holin family protein [Chlorobiota bacterium]
MENARFEDSLKDALAGLQYYVELQVKYNKLLFAKRTGEISAFFILIMLLLVVFSFSFLFLTLAFVEWYAQHVGDRFSGRLIVGAFYLLLGIIVLIFRKSLIYGPVRKFMGSLFPEELSEEGKSVFHTNQALNKDIIKHKKAIKEQEKDLKEKFEHLEDFLSFPNLMQNAVRSAYQSFLTAKNMAKLSYLMMNGMKKAFTSLFSRKHKKEPPKKLEGKDKEEE